MTNLAYDPDDIVVDGDVNTPEADQKSQSQSIWISIRRYIGAFFIYLIYWLTVFGAFRLSVGTNLSLEEARELVETGVIDSVSEYGWGDHYIWFLITFCFASYWSAILAGATAKKRGAMVAGIANIPLVVPISFLCVCLYISRIEIEPPIAWGIILPVSVLGSIFLSIVGGSAGERWQNSMFSSKTILGIRPLHWWWLIFPLNLTILTLVPKVLGGLSFIVSSTLVSQTKYCVLLFFMFVACATSIYFITWGWYKAFRLLSAYSMPRLSRFRTVLSVLFYLFGIPISIDVLFALVIIIIR